MPRIVFYISGHGFGHSVRSAEILQELITLCPEAVIQVRTTAPRMIFSHLPRPQVRLTSTDIDSGVVEDNPLRVDVAATISGVRALFEKQDDVVESECAFIRDADPHLILADIPYLAGAVAQASGRPCVAIGNFTWDWIYEPYLDRPETRDLYEFVASGYAGMNALLQLPFGHPVRTISRVVRVPLVARRARRQPEETRERLGLPHDRRPVVLIGMRGDLPEELLAGIADRNKDIVFLYLQDPLDTQHENLRHVRLNGDLRFPDLLRVSDAVVSKLGYGMVADAIANGTRILWPRRAFFREEDVMGVEVSHVTPAREIPLKDFRSGNWGHHLQELLTAPNGSQGVAMNGGEVCARQILEML